MGSRFIRWMRARQGKGQPIRSDGIERHVLEKKGTPTMGGFMILAGLVVGTLIWADLSNLYVWVVLMVTAGYGLLGFMDDYAKVTKQTTAGLSGRQKLLAQFVIAFAATLLVVLFGARSRGRRTSRPRWPSRCSRRSSSTSAGSTSCSGWW